MKGNIGSRQRNLHPNPVIVFGSPPGTGNTYAFKAITAKTGWLAYALNAAKLKKNMSEAPMALPKALDYIGKQLGACLFVHEAAA